MPYYSLNVREKNSPERLYNHEEILTDKRKRSSLLEGSTIENLDSLTSKFTSFEDMVACFNELYQKRLELYDPIIIADYNSNLLGPKIISDIVYMDDKKMIDDVQSIKSWLEEYLKNNPNDMYLFRGIQKIKEDHYGDVEINNDLIRILVLSYFNNVSYKGVRDVYFTLKKNDQSRVKKDEVHR